MERVVPEGRHLSVGHAPFRVRGVTYGSFGSRMDGRRYPDRVQIKEDLLAIAEAGLNVLRTYSLPPPELLEIAEELHLRVLVGLDYHDWRMEPNSGRAARRRILDAGRAAVAEAMDLCAGNPAVLAIAVGNEVPVDLVRVHGIRSVQRTLERLIADVHAADPDMLATYVNFPTTEFLEVEGQDLVCFNVFLEDPEQLRRYLSHLQVVATPKPLLVTELGLAGDIHGWEAQAESLGNQLQVVDETGCAGATVFSWTDDWSVADRAVEGWGFGLTTRDRRPKPAFDVVSDWARHPSPRSQRTEWPRMSVIVCAYNEERTIDDCLSSLAASDYPDLEVLMCDDGSTDRTLEIARRYSDLGFQILELPHGGLSRARNAGLAAATGEIVAYLDADAACHPDWPYYLALSLTNGVAATGGPNLPFPNAGFVERAVALSPGAPMEVLVTYDRAEHVPGCNMAYKKEKLEAIGGFDPVYTSAGDDVDVCWKLLDQGEEIGYAPAAQVIHHRRDTIRGYLKQQRGYGRAERMLSGPHRQRFNRLGQARWSGFVYNGARFLPSLLRPTVYHGYQAMAPFQPVTSRPAEQVGSLVTALLPVAVPVAVLGLALSPFSLWALLVPAAMAVLALTHAVVTAAGLRVDRHEPHPWRLRLLVGILHVAQPLVRAWGRIRGRPAGPALATPFSEWSGNRAAWLVNVRTALQREGCSVRIGDPSAAWDLEARSWLGFVAIRVTTALAWNWEPRHRIRYGLRANALIGLSAGLLLLALDVTAGGLVLGLLTLELLLEARQLRKRAARAVNRSLAVRAMRSLDQLARPTDSQ